MDILFFVDLFSMFVIFTSKVNSFSFDMSVLVNKDSRVIVQGFTGSEGTFHSKEMIAYGTNIIAGVTPGKGGQTQARCDSAHRLALV